MKHSDLPDAVPVVTIVGPAQAACSACAWCDHSAPIPAAAQRAQQRRVQLVRERLGDRGARALEGLAHEPLVGAAEVQQGAPGVDFGGDGHALP